MNKKECGYVLLGIVIGVWWMICFDVMGAKKREERFSKIDKQIDNILDDTLSKLKCVGRTD